VAQGAKGVVYSMMDVLRAGADQPAA
jgi:hypothetical protein